MATQSGIMPLEGSLGNYTFYKTKNGYRVRVRGGVSADKIASDDRYQRTRENNAEFTEACKSGRLLRFAFRKTIGRAKDSYMIGRLTALMLQVLQADRTGDRGSRKVAKGNTKLFLDFNFNDAAKLPATLQTAYAHSFDRTTGEAIITVDDFVPSLSLAAPAGTTHFRLFAAASALDFSLSTNDTASAVSEDLIYGNDATGDIALTMTTGKNSTAPVFLVLGVEFMQEVNSKMYELQSGFFNACAVIGIEVPS